MCLVLGHLLKNPQKVDDCKHVSTTDILCGYRITNVRDNVLEDQRPSLLGVRARPSLSNDPTKSEEIIFFHLVLGMDVPWVLVVSKDLEEEQETVGIQQELADIVER